MFFNNYFDSLFAVSLCDVIKQDSISKQLRQFLKKWNRKDLDQLPTVDELLQQAMPRGADDTVRTLATRIGSEKLRNFVKNHNPNKKQKRVAANAAEVVEMDHDHASPSATDGHGEPEMPTPEEQVSMHEIEIVAALGSFEK